MEKSNFVIKYVYLVLNKPKGYVSATTDEREKTVINLCPDEFLNRNLFPVGRLDKDTTGLMIISDDGDFAHNILSPKKHVSKKYYVELSGDLSTAMVDDFKNGIRIKKNKNWKFRITKRIRRRKLSRTNPRRIK